MRFDYVKYDTKALADQLEIKKAFEGVESFVLKLNDGRAKALVLTKLEEAYMWAGKAIRDEQLKRSSVSELQEERGSILPLA